MSIKKHEKILIDVDKKNVTVIVSTFPATKGLKLKFKLLKLIVPSFASLGNVFSKKESEDSIMDSDININSFIDGLMNISTIEENIHLIKELLEFTRLNNLEVADDEIFDDVFSGDMGLLYNTLFFVLEANYKSLFNLNGIGKLSKMIEKLPIPKNLKNKMKK